MLLHKNHLSNTPPVCVLSPLLFSLDTSADQSWKLLKFSDNTAVIDLIKDNDESAYRHEVVPWWCQNHLELNLFKFVEMTDEFCRQHHALPPITILKNLLNTSFSQELSWSSNMDTVWRRTQQRLSFLQQLKTYNLTKKLLATFYTAKIQSVLSLSLTVWIGSSTKQNRYEL